MCIRDRPTAGNRYADQPAAGNCYADQPAAGDRNADQPAAADCNASSSRSRIRKLCSRWDGRYDLFRR